MGTEENEFDGTTRRSDYLPLADGTRLAYDLILPTIGGRLSERPLPTLFKYTPYVRAYMIRGEQGKDRVAELYRMSPSERAHLRDLDLLDPRDLTGWLADLVRQGYAAIVVERPGAGASFGKIDPTPRGMAREAEQVLRWIADQEWSNGRIGMWGDSWQGQTQLAAASTGNPHLKAIMPSATWMDGYHVYYPGGIYNRAFGQFFVWSTTMLDSSIITPVDADIDGSLLAQARAERGGSTVGQTMTDALWRAFPFRDSEIAAGLRMWEFASAYPLLDQINAGGVPVYLVAGWYDIFARDVFLLYRNLTVPKRLLVRPLDHSQIDKVHSDLDYGAEVQRWFDHWLKGIDNGIMDEPAVRYYVLGDADGRRWQARAHWPPGEPQAQLPLYLTADRGLTSSPPAAAVTGDTYAVDYRTTTGESSRWTAINWEHLYGDRAAEDARAMCYTSAPLQASVQAVGHPVASLWLRTVASDLDIFVYIEEVDDRGRSTYITEGALRATHRAAAQPPYDNLGLPYHDHFQGHLEAIPGAEPFEVAIDLEPTGFAFPSGGRIRLTIAFADADNFDTPVLEPAPSVELLRDRKHPSRVDIPIMTQ